MKLLKEYINFLLIESRISDAKEKYPDINVDALAAFDPSRNYKYLNWMAEQVVGGEDQRGVEDAILKFHANIQHLQKKDINAYKDLAELEATLQIVDKPSKTQKKKIAKTGGSVIYEDDDVTVKYIKTKAAAVQYGKGTKWCISMSGAHHFEDYTNKGISFYFIFKNEPEGNNNDKIAIAVVTMKTSITRIEFEYYDAADNLIDNLPKNLNVNAILDAVVSHAGIEETEFNKFIRGKYNNNLEEKKQIANKLLDEYVDHHNDAAGNAVFRIMSNITDLDHLLELTEHQHPMVREMLAANEHINNEIFEELLYDKNEDVRISLCENIAIPVKIAEALLDDPSSKVRNLMLTEWAWTREEYMHLPKLQWDITKNLVHDEDPQIRSVIASYRSTPPDQAVKYFLNDPYPGVRRSLANRRDLNHNVYMTLAKDKHREVQTTLIRNLAVPNDVIEVIKNQSAGSEIEHALKKRQKRFVLFHQEKNY